jgi:hypothetical protein
VPHRSFSRVLIAGLALTSLACEQSITGIPDPVVEAAPEAATALVKYTASLISWWSADGVFDDVEPNGTPNSIVYNSGVDGRTRVTPPAGGTVGFSTGAIGNAFLFSGAAGAPGQFLEISDAPELRPSVFTIDLWAQRIGPGQVPVEGAIIQKAIEDNGFDPTSGMSYYISWRKLGDGTHRIEADVAFPGDGFNLVAVPVGRLVSGPVVDGVWVHVAVTVDEDRNATLYLNGVQQSTFQGASGTPRYDTGSIVIGNYWKWNRETWDGATFNGCIDEVRIFDGVSIPAVVDPIGRFCGPPGSEPLNTPPTAVIDEAGEIDEGSAFVTTGRFNDVDVDDTWSLMVDYDDGSGFVS